MASQKSSGKYYPETEAGNVFIGSTIVGGKAIMLSTATSVTNVMLWNSSVTKNAVLLKATIGFTSGTLAVGEFGLGGAVGLGAVEGTGNPMAAFTDGVAETDFKNAKMGGGQSSVMRFSVGATASTLTTASTALVWFGASLEDASAISLPVVSYDFDGTVIVTPGSAVFFVGSIAQTALCTCSLTWAEVTI